MTQEERIDQLLEAVGQLITHTQLLNKKIDDLFSTKVASLKMLDPRAAPSLDADPIPSPPNNTS